MEATNTSRAASEARFLECQCGEDGGGKERGKEGVGKRERGRGGSGGREEMGMGIQGRFPCEDIVSVPVSKPRIQTEPRQRRDS